MHYDHNTPSHSSEASEPFDGRTSFDAAPDLTECHCGFFAKYDHAHACCCGAEVTFYDGGRELDGTQYREFDTQMFAKCSVCKDYVCNERGHVFYIEEGKPLCSECEREEAGKILDAAHVQNALADASEDIRDSHRRMLRETDSTLLQALDIQIKVLATQVALYQKALDNKLAAHNALPFIFNGAV